MDSHRHAVAREDGVGDEDRLQPDVVGPRLAQADREDRHAPADGFQGVDALVGCAIGQDDMVGMMTAEMSARNLTLARRTETIEGILTDNWYWGKRDRIATKTEREQALEMCYPDLGATAGIAEQVISRLRERQTLDAIDENTGLLQWSWTPPADAAQARTVGNILLTRNLVFVSTEGNDGSSFVWALDRATRQPVWKHAGGGYVIMSGAQTIYVLSGPGNGRPSEMLRAFRMM